MDSQSNSPPPPPSSPEPAGSPTQALIKRLRAMGLSQSEIFRRTGIPQPRLSRWENGEVAAGADDALRLQDLEAELVRERGEHPMRRATDIEEHDSAAAPVSAGRPSADPQRRVA